MNPPEHTDGSGQSLGRTSASDRPMSPDRQGFADERNDDAPPEESTAFLPRITEDRSAGELVESDDRDSATGGGPEQGQGAARASVAGNLHEDVGSGPGQVFGYRADEGAPWAAGAAAGTTTGERATVNATSGQGTSAPSALRRPGRGPRRANLQVKRLDPWSVLKLVLVFGIAMFLMWLVAVGLLYTVLDGMGVWDRLNGTYASLVAGEPADAPVEPLITAGRVFGGAAVIGMINIVLMSALATVSAFIYNISADMAGGLELTLSERE